VKNLSLTGCSSAEPVSVSVFKHKIQLLQLYLQTVKKAIHLPAMDGKGRAIDNIFIERLWRTVKQDYVYLHPAQNGLELYQGLKQFFNEYNTKKTHQGIGRKIPLQVYQQCR